MKDYTVPGRWMAGVVGVGVFLGMWYELSTRMSPIRLPSPLLVAEVAVPLLFKSDALAVQFGYGSGGILPHLLVSISRLVVGTALGVLAGLGLGLLMSYSDRLGWFLDFPTRMLRSVPAFGWIPFLLVWFGTWEGSQIILVSVYIFLIILANTLNAITNLSQVYVRFSRTLGATRLRSYRDVVLPAILPELVGGLRVALAFAWGLLVVGELVGGRYGIGRVLSLLIPLLQTPALIAAICWIAVFAVIIDALFVRAERRLLRWHHAWRE